MKMNINIIQFKSKNNFELSHKTFRCCNGGELFDEIIRRKRFSEKDAAIVMQQVLSAVLYCHEKNIVHRDLKPENILLDDKNTDILNTKVIDFGASQVFDANEKLTERFGTIYYISPEVLKGDYGAKCDIWSLGVILYILLCGEPPFNGDSDEKIMEKILKGKYEFKCNHTFSSKHFYRVNMVNQIVRK